MSAPTRASTALVLLACLAMAPQAAAGEDAREDPERPGPNAFAMLGPAPGEERPASRPWRPERVPDIGVGDLVVIGAGASVQLAAEIVPPQPRHAQGGWLFDEGARDALRARTATGRHTARGASDVGVSLAATWPFLIDALVTAWWYRGNAGVARDMAIVDAEAMAVTMGLHGIAEYTVSRERPYGRECGGGIPEKSADCDHHGRYRSFFSGHSAISFTGAGLVCSHHVRLGLLGPPGDAISCAGAIGVAFATSALRVVGDVHYATDALTGLVVGASSGLLVPLIRSKPASETAGASRLHLVPVGWGLGLGGAF